MQSFALTSPSLPAADASPWRRSLAATPVRAAAVTDEPKLNKYSARITEPKSQGASQAVLYGVGLTDADLRKPQVVISSVGITCNMHLLSLAEAVRDGVRSAGMVAFRFNTVGVSDAISMGTRGMCYSLQSRDLIADSIETVMGAQHYDANISIPGCDKNMPGIIVAVLYGVGLTDTDLFKPQVEVSFVWYEGNTIGVSGAISMGTCRGMCYSLQSRDLIPDSIETLMGAQHYDANISIPGCDKNVRGDLTHLVF